MNDMTLPVSTAHGRGTDFHDARRRRRSSIVTGRRCEQPARGAIVMFHRGHEHSGRMAHLVDELRLPDFDFFAWDARGHGRSPGRARRFAQLRRRPCAMSRPSSTISAPRTALRPRTSGSLRKASARYWSRRGCTTMRRRFAPWCSRRPPSRSSCTFRSRCPACKLMRRLRGNFFITSYVKAQFLTRDPERMASYGTDPLLSKQISVNVLLGLQEAADRVVADAAAITVPTQLLISGADWVVETGTAAQVFRPAGIGGEGAARTARFLSRHARRARSRARSRARAVVPLRVRSPRRASARICSTPTSTVRRARRPTRSPHRCPRCRRADCTGRLRAPISNSAASSPTASGSAMRPDSIRARRSTTFTAIVRRASRRWAG